MRRIRKAAIVGAAGYTGVELTRLLAGHPWFDLVMVTSRAEAGRAVSDLHPVFAGSDLEYEVPDPESIARLAEVAFLAVPHTAAMGMTPALLDAGITVIDLSADFRLHDPGVYEAWYGVPHEATSLLAEAVYGLPELDRDALAGARLVACAGCYPTATVLAAFPAMAAGIVDPKHVIVDAKSGVSGAGKGVSDSTHYCTVNEGISAYKVAVHRHTPEIAQSLSGVVGSEVAVTFTPHLIPMTRGLLATVYMRLTESMDTMQAVALYQEKYSEEHFITVHEAGSMPSTREVSGSNRAHLGVAVDMASEMLVVTCAIDNLVKGAAGQAVQCANVVFGLDESAGLDAIGPVV